MLISAKDSNLIWIHYTRLLPVELKDLIVDKNIEENAEWGLRKPLHQISGKRELIFNNRRSLRQHQKKQENGNYRKNSE